MRTPGLKKILAFTLLPQIMPRFRDLFSGFTFVAFFIAQVYRSAGLLPAGHPYLLSSNMGRFGISHVMAEAGLLLKKNRASIDQVAIYWLLMTGLVILAAQVGMLALGLFVQAAHAAPPVFDPGTNFFITLDPDQDLAFILLDYVFGIPDFFNSCVATGGNCLGSALNSGQYWTNTARTATADVAFPYPSHLAMRSMFQLYSTALLVIGVLILLYFVFAVLAETAETGTPFGRRFNKVWAPLRLVVALGLLIPIANGLNAAQYVALYAAKFGSGFATNGWTLFADAAVQGGTTMLGTPEALIAVSNPPPINTLMTFSALLSTCKLGYERMSDYRGDNPPIRIHAFLVNPRNQAEPRRIIDDNFVYAEALDYYKHGNIVVRFGEYREMDGKPVYTNAISNVEPLCGEVTMMSSNADQNDTPGAYHALEQYYESTLGQLWANATAPPSTLYQTGDGETLRNMSSIAGPNPNAPLPTTAEMVEERDNFAAGLLAILNDATEIQAGSPVLTDNMTQYGWAGAGIWYNRLAQVNGSLISAIYNLPSVTKMPEIMEEIQKKRLANDHDVTGPERFMPYDSDDHEMKGNDNAENQIGKALYQAYKLWSDNFTEQSVTGNIFVDGINSIFGTSGLFNIRQNADRGVHPLAQLVAIGRGILESAVRNLGWAAVAGLGGGIINMMSAHLVGTVAMAASGFLMSVALIALSIGFVLYYVLPFMPFLFFFFAVGGWVKAIFEAMVGVPLWALAHLRIDGNGLPGDAAIGGYFMVLEIFLRPILIIFGMLGGTAIFSAQAAILNEIWQLVASNVVGFDRVNVGAGDETGAIRYVRDAVDTLFFTVIYAIVVYMLGMSSFKMVDMVPNYIMRWIGTSVDSFSNERGDSPEGIMTTSAVGADQFTDSIRGIVSQGGRDLGGATKALSDRITKKA